MLKSALEIILGVKPGCSFGNLALRACIIQMFVLHHYVLATWSVTGGNLTSVGLVTPTTISQTSSAGSPNGKAPYWSFNGTAGVIYFFSFCTSGTSEDPVMAVYSGPSPGGALVAANDDYCGLKPGLTFVCPATQTYYICADVSTGALPFTFSNLGTVILTYYICGGASSTLPPITEDWSAGGSSISTACSGWSVQGAGCEGDWTVGNTTRAGGTTPELRFTGNQANIYGVGVTKNVTITSAPINTSTTSNLVFSWKHTLRLTSNCGPCGTSGTDDVILKLQSSTDLITWTDRYVSPTYSVTGSATTPVNQVTQTVSFNPGSAITYLRFLMIAVPFKIRDWDIDNGGALPVTLISFSGVRSGQDVFLNWQTASEWNNDYFSLERSVDGNDWSMAGTIKGAGNSSMILNYEFLDETGSQFSSMHSRLFYRLKQTDYDGRYEYFGPIAVDLSAEGGWTLVIKNPSSASLTGTLITDDDDRITLQLTDLQGRIVAQQNLEAVKGSNMVEMDINLLEKGVYLLRAFNRSGSVIHKFVKP